MYTKLSHGTSFLGAALYDAEGLSKAQQQAKANKTELLYTANLLSTDARGIAAEMTAVARYSRSQKPVWNIAMSAPAGITLSPAQWQEAAELNLQALGVEPGRHQYAIYRHRDTTNDHIHILLNAVPVDGGPALSRQFKAVQAQKAAQAIDQVLGIMPTKGPSIRDELSLRLGKALQQRPTTADELTSDLAGAGVIVDYLQNTAGIYGVSFRLSGRDHKPVKGSALTLEGRKLKWSAISALLEANRAQYEAEIGELKEKLSEAEKQRRDEVNEVYEKRDIIRNAFTELKREYDSLKQEKNKAEAERDEILRRRPQPGISGKPVSDPADKAAIEQLKQENEALKRQLAVSEQIARDVNTQLQVKLTPAQANRLATGKELILSDRQLKLSVVDNKLRIWHLPAAAKAEKPPVPSVAEPPSATAKVQQKKPKGLRPK